MSRSSSN